MAVKQKSVLLKKKELFSFFWYMLVHLHRQIKQQSNSLHLYIRGRAAFQRFVSTDVKHAWRILRQWYEKCVAYSMHLGISAQSEIGGVHDL